MKQTVIAALMAATALPALAQDFPLEITHKFGTAEIPAAPERVVSLDSGGIDNLLALGIQPAAVKFWYGEDYPLTAWPWAQDLLTTTPEVLRGDLNFEQIAGTNPDVIVGLASGMDQADFDKLTQIAPTVAVPEGYPDYGGMAWDELALRAGQAVGKEDEARRQIQALRDRLAQIRADHPEWEGKTASVAFYYDGKPGAYTSIDRRPRLLAELGFITPEAIDETGEEGAFYVSFSPEDVSPMDTDLVIWFGSGDDFTDVENIAARPFLSAYETGAEVFMGDLMSGAYSHGSLLSLNYAIDRMVPMIEAALDGDPTTNADDLTRD